MDVDLAEYVGMAIGRAPSVWTQDATDGSVQVCRYGNPDADEPEIVVLQECKTYTSANIAQYEWIGRIRGKAAIDALEAVGWREERTEHEQGKCAPPLAVRTWDWRSG